MCRELIKFIPMNTLTWKSSAPSNIALIKYMGKIPGLTNQTVNPTLSYTLKHLTSDVELVLTTDSQDRFEPLPNSNLNLGGPQEKKFLNFLNTIKTKFNCNHNFIVKSRNNFPSDCGLASSASSFAALTSVATKAICELQEQPTLSIQQQALLSREGSGSSCRSFFSPWGFWSENTVSELQLPYTNLYHMVFVVSKAQKKVSSSEAHKRVPTSQLFEGRAQRARIRMGQLVEALQIKNWPKAYEICWAEFWDMHALFETSTPSFGYIMPETMEILNWIRDFWKMIGDGPIVTMDAGPNIHFLFRPDQKEMMENFYKKWSPKYLILKS